MTNRAARAAAPEGPDAPAQEARRLSTLLEVSQALSGTLNLKASLHRVLDILGQRGDPEACVGAGRVVFGAGADRPVG